ncbi:hypothetical protein M758_9G048200 [Ceratodon purpureus]|uniref:FAS1 domain-containing protein n=1 Tax=Ceratodon purpureus TaxID=3225 RepID=A0A8T0GQP3_CERPU|nr:hypothetical protein KC19_9G048800 [Ceratodon purpureus]KAG0605314.1 hypothetical protein M758_9G048200 [Ceratodon purpureus]
MAARSCVLILVMVLAVVLNTSAQTCQTGLVNTMNQFPDLSTLVQFINEAGLTDRINNTDITDNVTFVAPNNNAFDAFNVTLQQNNLTFANITDKDNNRAGSIILYHVITGVGALDITKTSNGQSLTTMLEGHNLTVSKGANNSVTFIGGANNATLQTASPGEVSVCFSKIYIVNRVLLPNATLASIPIHVSGASTSAITGQWAFALSIALAAALIM